MESDDIEPYAVLRCYSKCILNETILSSRTLSSRDMFKASENRIIDTSFFAVFKSF